MKNIIGYVRVSTENQKEGYGLAVQEAAIKKYAKDNKCNLIKIFRDEAVSGALKNRPALIELMDYAEINPKMNLTLVFLRLDRLARDLLVQETLLSEFQQKGLLVVSIDEPDLLSSEPTRILFRQLKGAISGYEKAVIAMRMSAGRLKKVESGYGYAGGNICYGYEYKNGSYVPVETEIKVVREIYRLRRKRSQGKRSSYQKIADMLNQQGIHAPMATKWYPMSVRYIALNKFYKGYQKYSSVQVYNPSIKILKS